EHGPSSPGGGRRASRRTDAAGSGPLFARPRSVRSPWMREVPFADPDLDEIPAFLRPPEAPRPPVPEAPVTLPSSGSGERARRRRHQRRSVWRRRSAPIAVVLALAVAITVLAVRPWHWGGAHPYSRQQAKVP